MHSEWDTTRVVWAMARGGNFITSEKKDLRYLYSSTDMRDDVVEQHQRGIENKTAVMTTKSITWSTK